MNKKNIDPKSEDLRDEVEKTMEDAIEEVDDIDQGGETMTETELLKEAVGKEKDKFLRLFAEFENYKKRTGKERVELFKTANEDMMVALLPVLDDFDRALNEISKAKDKELVKGVELIQNKFRETLRAKGLSLMEVKEGDTFDSELHEAVTQIPAPSNDLKGKVIDVVAKGYKLGDKIIRYPKVVTGM